jgi:alpha-glucosidase
VDGLTDDMCTLLVSTDPGRAAPPAAVPLSSITLRPGEGVLLRLHGPGRDGGR